MCLIRVINILHFFPPHDTATGRQGHHHQRGERLARHAHAEDRQQGGRHHPEGQRVDGRPHGDHPPAGGGHQEQEQSEGDQQFHRSHAGGGGQPGFAH